MNVTFKPKKKEERDGRIPVTLAKGPKLVMVGYQSLLPNVQCSDGRIPVTPTNLLLGA